MVLNDYTLQDSGSPSAQECFIFHEYSLGVMVLIFVLVSIVLGVVSWGRQVNTGVLEDKGLEIFWTLLPSVILVVLAFPSLKLLYVLENQVGSGGKDMKVLGHQWYWSYDVSVGGDSLEYDSYMVANEDLQGGDFRSLEVDNPIVWEFQEYNNLLVSSSDVLHSFAVPVMGVKVDAVPGRLNSQSVFPYILGVFYGQCSEICGASHAFMPMSVEVGLKG